MASNRDRVKMRQALKRILRTQGRGAYGQAIRRARKLGGGPTTGDSAEKGLAMESVRAQKLSPLAEGADMTRFAAGGLAPLRARRR